MRTGGLVASLAAALALSGCAASPCQEAAQICADEGRSVGAPGSADASCEGRIEAQAECLADEGSCAPDVVEACWEAVGGADEDAAQGS